MNMWFRIFGIRETAPEPAALLEHLHGQGLEVEGHFKGDDHGWFQVDFLLAGDARPLHLERYLTTEDDIRDDLHSWAAWVELANDPAHSNRLMQLLIGANQVFTLPCPRDRFEESGVEHLCLTLCRFLAAQTGGVYQVDSRGFFDPNGKLLISEGTVPDVPPKR